MLKLVKSKIKTFVSCQDGTASIEFALWLPIMATLLTFTVDATMLMHRQTIMYDVSRDASRVVSLGIMTAAEAEEAVLARVTSANATADVRIVDGIVTTTLQVPLSDIALFDPGWVGVGPETAKLTAAVSMWVGDLSVDPSAAGA